MKKEIAMRWVKALRSGRYKQGFNRLRDYLHGTHCCLGVLAEEMGAQWDEDGLLNSDGSRSRWAMGTAQRGLLGYADHEEGHEG